MSERRHVILATFRTDPGERELLHEMFGAEHELAFLEDCAEEERAQALRGAEILISFGFPREVHPDEIPLLERARLLQLASAGADHVPYERLPENITVASNVGAYAEPMAEHVVGMTLALAKRLYLHHERLKRGEFKERGGNRMLKGKICGVLGFGGIGRAVARLMRALGMQIYAINRRGATDEPVEFIGTLEDLRSVLQASDVVVISLPLNRHTRHLIGERELSWMKPDAILINVARGAIIREQALYEHLKAHPEFMSGLDVWWDEPFTDGRFHTETPIMELPNVLGSPHNSPLVPGALLEGLRRAAENVRRFLNDDPLAGLVRREDYLELNA